MAKKVQVQCDRTGKPVPLIEGFFVASPKTGDWEFVAEGARESTADYNVAVASLLESPEEFCDWMAHLSEKVWFEPAKFFDFFVRMRAKIGG